MLSKCIALQSLQKPCRLLQIKPPLLEKFERKKIAPKSTEGACQIIRNYFTTIKKENYGLFHRNGNGHDFVNFSLPCGDTHLMAKSRVLLGGKNYFLTKAGFSTGTTHDEDNGFVKQVKPRKNVIEADENFIEDAAPSNLNTQIKNGDERTMEISKEKLRQILHELGMSISQWNVRKNEHQVASPLNTSSQPGRRRRRHPRVNEKFDAYNVQGYNNNRRRSNNNNIQSEKISARLRVRSVHAAHTIDIVSTLTKVFGPMSKMPATRHMFSKTSLIVQLPSVIDNKFQSAESYNDVDAFFHPRTQPRFIAIFRYGSIVFFNVSPKDAGRILEQVKDYSTEPIARSFERKEHFEVAISPQMQQDAHVTSDFAAVRELNINTVAVISTIMGQTVAFDSYNDVVDELLATFDEINSTVKKTGNFTDMQKETLFKVVAQNNSLFIDMIAKLGIKDRSDTAWNMSQYERIHEGMKHEFEIESRFEYIEFKLNLIQQNAKFFLEILHNQKTDTLEWTIIVLIAFECTLMILDMSGFGQNLFDILLPSSDPQAVIESKNLN